MAQSNLLNWVEVWSLHRCAPGPQPPAASCARRTEAVPPGWAGALQVPQACIGFGEGRQEGGALTPKVQASWLMGLGTICLLPLLTAHGTGVTLCLI